MAEWFWDLALVLDKYLFYKARNKLRFESVPVQ